MLYFAYGSNMSSRRLQQRILTVRSLGTAILHGHQLRFHKMGSDGSGKCDAYCTDVYDDVIHGVLFEIDDAGKATLDGIEGLGFGYDDKEVEVLHGGSEVRAVTYIATRIDEKRQPFAWYHQHVVVGAQEAELPEAYLRNILDVTVIDDPDPIRHAKELAIYEHVLAEKAL
ncbi:MAG: gamma-glutamylcyclotransferase family protein [Pseudomonadota bacterium]